MKHPLAIDRLAEIRRRLDVRGSVTVAELSQGLGVSRETVRRDLKLMAENGSVEIVHGGATRTRVAEPALAERAEENAAGKSRIARAAARLVPEGATVLIDSGTTTFALAQELAGQPRLTVATNSLSVATVMCRGGHRVHMLGGEVDDNDESTMSHETIEALARYRFDIAFVGTGGLSVGGGLTDYIRTAADFRSRLIVSATQSWLLADHSKFGRETPFPIENFERLAGIVTDARMPRDLAAMLRGRGLDVIVAD